VAPGGRRYEVLKWLLDLRVALLVLVLGAPLWLAIALLVRLTSPGPVLYRGQVIGRYGRPFTYYKFRTMRTMEEDEVHRQFIERYVLADEPFVYEIDPHTGAQRPVYKVISDPRVTPLGRWLRRTSLDEIPQFINVLRGEMSVVGPRPPVPYEYALYTPWARGRLSVLPGITGLAQIRGRGTVPFTEMVEMDLEYIRRRSLWLDLQIILQTIPLVLLGHGYTG